MQNDSVTQEQKDIKKKHLSRKSKLFIVLAIFFLINLIIYKPFIPSPAQKRYQKASKEIILKAIAAQLNKKPENMTCEDFESITKLSIVDKTKRGYMSGVGLSDIKLLKKFKNLRELDLSYIRPIQSEIPKWKKLLVKLHIIKISKTPLLDLKPLRGLKNLQILDLSNTNISNLEPIKNLKNLLRLYFKNTKVTDLEPLRGLTNLQELQFINTKVSNLEPIKDLKNLRKLATSMTDVNDLEPLKELTNLEDLYMYKSNNIKKEQIENLQKALPELEIHENILDVGSTYF